MKPSSDQPVVLLASCQYPPDLTNSRIAYRSLERMGRRVAELKTARAWPILLLVAGDSIYADATAGLFDPVRERDRYEGPYRQLRNQPAWLRLRGQIDAMHASVDDHELEENWEPVAPTLPGEFPSDGGGAGARAQASARLQRSLTAGLGAFRREFVHRHRTDHQGVGEPIWGATESGPVHCFVMDTRTEREFRAVDRMNRACLFSACQYRRLIRWLVERQRHDPAGAKFVLSGSMLLPRRRMTAQATDPAVALLSDAWDGYPAALTAVLDFIARHRIENVVFLSGDEHLGCLATITLTRPELAPLRVISVHAPPLHAPFPFANGRPHHYAGEERFTFSGARRHGEPAARPTEVKVVTRFAPAGDGFVELRAGQGEDFGWFDCRFDVGPGPGGARRTDTQAGASAFAEPPELTQRISLGGPDT